MRDYEYDGYAMEEPCISLHALTGEKTFHTVRIVGFVKHKPLYILVDSGITHNFLDIEYARKLGCETEQIPPQEVTIADGINLFVNTNARISLGT